MKKKYFTSELRVSHPDFGYAPPPPPPHITPSRGSYQATLLSKTLKAYSKPVQDFQPKVNYMNALEVKLHSLSPFFSEADEEELKTCCYLGFGGRHHAQSDEGRSIGNDFEIDFDQEVLSAVSDQWKKTLRAHRSEIMSSLRLVMPTGTSLGWPYLFQDNSDNVRTFFLGMMALALQADRSIGRSLADVESLLERSHGARFIVPGWRYQHTKKVVPMFTREGMYWTQNLEFRTRLIAMVGKEGVLWNRRAAKIAINTALKMPQHAQNRTYIQSVISKWQNDPSLQVVAVDVSGFDNGFGGKNLVTLLSVYSDITGTDHQDLVSEVSAPMLVPFGQSLYTTTQRVTPQLPSGASFTSGVGLLAGDYLIGKLYKILGISLKPHYDGVKVMYLNWGDDMLIAVPKAVDVKKAYDTLSLHSGLEFDFEPTIKYLGFNYGSGSLQADHGYSIARLVIKSLLPEQKTFYPFSLIGYAARLQFITKAKEFHDIFTTLFWEDRYGPKFPFSELKSRLSHALEESAKLDSVPRDTLNFLLHGNNPEDDPNSLSHIDFDFSKWIGNSFIDVTDPEKAVRDSSSKLASVHLRWIRQVADSGTPALIGLADQLSAQYSWRGGQKLSPYF